MPFFIVIILKPQFDFHSINNFEKFESVKIFIENSELNFYLGAKICSMKVVNFQKKLGKDIFNDSHFYLGFSSTKRSELAKEFRLPSEYKTQIYKSDTPTTK